MNKKYKKLCLVNILQLKTFDVVNAGIVLS